jgi:hypothetical protein
MKHLCISLVAGLLLPILALGALGDSAPAIPSTYKVNHPRLPFPSNAELLRIWNSGSMPTRYVNAANAWNSAAPGGEIALLQLLVAYQASKAGGSPNATYLSKIQALMTLSTPGCTGNGCAWPGLGTLATGEELGLAYDWTYSDLTSGQRTAAQATIDAIQTFWENTAVPGNSPYNDQFYEYVSTVGMVMAGANCCTDHANGPAHLNKAMDEYLNIMLPVVEQLQGGDTTKGGGWHEAWADYQVASTTQITSAIFASLNDWASISGRGSAFFTIDHPTLKNFAYQTMYQIRGDLLFDKIGDNLTGMLVSECSSSNDVAGNALTFLAEVYNDSTLRGWARFVNGSCYYPDGTEPSQFPWFTPDISTHSVSGTTPSAARGTLPTMQTFPGLGVAYSVTGFGENDTQVRLKFGDNYWSHQHADAGSFSIFNRGALALGQSGTYRANTGSEHEGYYYMQAVSTSTLTITDPADTYSTESVKDVSCVTGAFQDNTGTPITSGIPNSGGQRLVGSPWQNLCRTGTGLFIHNLIAPYDKAEWLRNYDYYHMGNLLASVHTPTYDYIAADITPAYNDAHSLSGANTSNHTNRAQKVIRHLVTIRRGTAMYVTVYDQLISTNAGFTKRFLLHSISQPTIANRSSSAGPSFTISRTENVFSTPYGSLWPQQAQFGNNLTGANGSCPGGGGLTLCYQYGGKLTGFMVYPSGGTTGTIATVGGSGHEFDNAGTNYNQCTQPTGGATDCNSGLSGYDWGVGTGSSGLLSPDPTKGTLEAGSWRIEETFTSASTSDWYLNVMLASSSSDANVPASVTPTGDSTHLGASWSDSNCSYSLTFPKSGIGGTIVITNISGCAATVNESLLAHHVGTSVPPNSWQQVTATPYPASWVGFNTGVYVPPKQAMCWWEHYYQGISAEANDAWECYNPRHNRFYYQDITSNWHSENLPYGGHTFYSTDYSYSLGSVISNFPGSGASGAEDSPASIWLYDMIGGVGKNLNVNTPAPVGAAQFESGSYSQDRDTMVMLEYYRQNMLHWTPGSGQWIAQTITGTVPQLQSALHGYSSRDGKIYYFGGVLNGSTCSNSLYSYDPGSKTFSGPITTIGTPPPARMEGGMAWDSRRGGFLIIGGDNCNDSTGNTPYQDTWFLDMTQATPTWTQLSPISTYVNNVSGTNLIFESLVYDPDDDLYALVGGLAGAAALYVFSPDQAGYIGRESATYAYPSVQSLNITSNVPGVESWAYGSSLAVNGTSLSEMHGETGAVGSNIQQFARGRIWNGSGWSGGATLSYSDAATNLKSGYTSQATVANTTYVITDRGPSGGPWMSAYTGTWSTATQIPLVNSGAYAAGIAQIRNCGGTLVAAQLEQVRGGSVYNDALEVHVQSYNGSSWSAIGGTAALNTAAQTIANQISIDCTSTSNIWVAWPQMLPSFSNPNVVYTPPLIKVAQWNGSSWTQQAPSGLNSSSSNWASDPTVKLVGTTPYVLWVERSIAGVSSSGFQAIPAQFLYAKYWNGSSWVNAGAQPINRNINTSCAIGGPCSWVWHPSCDANVTNLYCSWVEQQAPAEPPQVVMSQWNGTAWTALGGSANASTTTGEPTHPNVVYYNGMPTISWTESFPGLMRQVYAAQYSASLGTFQPIGPATSTCSISPSSLGPWVNGQTINQALTASGCSTSSWAVQSGNLPTGLNLNSLTGAITGMISAGGTFSPTITYDTASQSYTITVTAVANGGALVNGGRFSGGVISH